MTIDDQIRNEKLQHDIDEEAAKISALSSGKLHKYEYLAGEDMLPSNQQQIIEQTKFTYSTLGKAFEKQIKTIEDLGEKRIKAIKEQIMFETIEKYAYNAEDPLYISKQKEIFNKIVDEWRKKIDDLDNKINNDDLIYRYKGNTDNLKFDGFDNAASLIDKIRNDEINLSDVKNEQWKFKKYLREIKKGRRKSMDQKNALYNIEMIYKARNEAIKFYDGCSLMMSEANTKAAKGSGLKTLTPKQMLQRLPIALAEVKAGNNSENLLNEIREIVYSLYHTKEITKKVYNNIINSL